MKKVQNENDFVSWVLIDSLGKLRFSKSSYYYIVVVPIIVKALDKVTSPLILSLGESELSINIDLPFSWYLFYFGAVAIAIGSLLYQIFCPEIIKSYKNYGEFLSSGESNNYLDRVASKYKIHNLYFTFIGQPYLEQKVKEPIKVPSMSRFEEPRTEEREKVVDYKHNIKYQEDRKEAFNQLHDKVKFSNKNLRYTSFSLYMLGFGAFGWVIIQNIYYVVKHLL